MDNLMLVENLVEQLPQSIKIYVNKWILRLKRPTNLTSEKLVTAKYCRLLRLQVKAILAGSQSKLEDPFNKFPKDTLLQDISEALMCKYMPRIEKKKSVDFLEELNTLEKSYQQDLAQSAKLNLELSQAPPSFSPQSNQQKNDLLFLEEIEKSMNMCKTRATDQDIETLNLLESSINQLDKSSKMISQLKSNDFFTQNLLEMVKEVEGGIYQFQNKINNQRELIKQALESLQFQKQDQEKEIFTADENFIDCQ